jgi:hypothetical protein
MAKGDNEETKDKEPKKESSNVFNLEEELQKETKYLRPGFLVYIKDKGYDVNTQKKYEKYLKEYKEA